MRWLLLVLCFHLHAERLLSPDEIAQFYKEGFLIKRQVFTSTEVRYLQNQMDLALEQAFASLEPSEEEQIHYLNGARIVSKKNAILRINGCAPLADLTPFLASDRLISAFCDLLGTNDLEHIIAQIHPKMPYDGVSFAGHCDLQFRKMFDPNWQDILGNGSYAICIIPVDRMNEQNGGLWVQLKNSDPLSLRCAHTWLALEPGDILFMHPELYHGSGPNNSPFPRRTLLTGFCAFGANHCPYPGAGVSVHFTRHPSGEITSAPAPWQTPQAAAPSYGH